MGTVINGPLGCSLLAELGARVIRVEAPGGDYIRDMVQGLAVHRTMAGAEGLCLNLKTSALAELGARVIRVEAPGGDYIRDMVQGLAVHRTMAGAEGLCLNLKTSEGREIVQKLVVKADILLHSMRPGAPERTGIGYEQLSKINPGLVYLYAGGYGSTGPHSHRPSMAPIPGAICGGALAQVGRDTLPPPDQELAIEEIVEISRKLGRANDGSNDHNASMVNSVAMLLGLYARDRTGKG